MNKNIMQNLKTFMYSVVAGICISIGGTVYLILSNSFPQGNILGSMFFAIGLFVICTRGYNLFTGKVCYTLENKLSYIIDLCLIWIGNFLGCIAYSFLLNLTRINAREYATNIVNTKMNDSYLSLFILGIICNILIFIAVDGYKKLQNTLGGYIAIFLGVSVFILIGSEHCIADMFYWCISNILYTDFTESILRILVITIGNIVGGLSIPLIEKINKNNNSTR